MSKFKIIKGKKQPEPPKVVEQPAKKKDEMTPEVVAAIGLALNMHLQDVHDYERAVITMQKVMRPYSPWSSKIYGLRQIPFRIPRQYK